MRPIEKNLTITLPSLNEKGFTMAELVIVIVLVGVIAMTASLLIGQAAQSYQKADNYSAVLNQARLAIEKMSREIRIIRSPGDITTCTATALTFRDLNGNGNVISYNYAGTTMSEGANPLADNISSFAFSYFDQSNNPAGSCAAIWTVTVDLTASQGQDTIPFRMTVHPRGF